MQKFNNKSKVKIRNRIGSIVIDKSRVPQSGVGGTTLNDGLIYADIHMEQEYRMKKSVY